MPMKLIPSYIRYLVHGVSNRDGFTGFSRRLFYFISRIGLHLNSLAHKIHAQSRTMFSAMERMVIMGQMMQNIQMLISL